MSSSKAPEVAVAIPLHNEEAVLPELLRRVGAVLDELPGGPHRVVCVDDGSVDATGALLADAVRDDPRVTAVSLSRNFGHQAALTAALDYAEGDVVVVMDGDLQDEPEVIPRFLEQFEAGYDVVYARRRARKESLFLRACYALFYRLIGALSEVPLARDAGDFALLSRRVVDALRAAPEHNRYLRGLRAWVGFRQTAIDVERAERAAGQSKYTFFKLVRLAFDGIFSFSIVPIRAAAILGLFAMLAAFGYAAYAVYYKLVLDQNPEGFTALVGIIVFLAGVQLSFVGLMGEYVARIYEEVKRRPIYITRQVLRGDGGRTSS